MKFSPDDILWGNGYLAKGDPLAICGPPGVGKTRFVINLLISLVTGREFLGWETNGQNTKWLILQTENGNRRLQADLIGANGRFNESGLASDRGAHHPAHA